MLEREDSDKGLAYWASRPFVTGENRDRVQTSSIVIVPWEGFREYEGPVFPVGTESLFRFLRANAPRELAVEIAVDDERFAEVALHSALVIIGGIVLAGAGTVATGVVTQLLVDYIKGQFPKAFGAGGGDGTQVRVRVTVDRGSLGSATLEYEGPPDLLKAQMDTALESLARSRPSDATNTDSHPASPTTPNLLVVTRKDDDD